MEKKLTVAITTYNRREYLITQLKSLECQGHYDQYAIIVFNNKSNYNVEEALREALSPDFMEIVTVKNRKYNVGGDCNIALSFQDVDTPWMWLLSDDDVTTPSSLETVLADIEKYQDVCWLKYSIEGGFKAFEDEKISDLAELFEKCSAEAGHGWGEFVFMSNNVYNMKYLYPYIGELIFYASTSFSQLIAPMFAMKNDNVPMILRSFRLTNYEGGRISYSNYYAYLNFPNLIYTRFSLTKTEIKGYKKIFNVKGRQLVSSLLDVKDKAVRCEYMKKYVMFYRFGNPFKKTFWRIAFMLINTLEINKDTLKKCFG